jgi:hypothetical protein
VQAWGGLDTELELLIERAWQSAAAGSADALELGDRAIFAMKSRGIP